MIAGGPDPNNPIIIIQQSFQLSACLMVNTLNNLFAFEPWTAISFPNSTVTSIQTINTITSPAGGKQVIVFEYTSIEYNTIISLFPPL